MRSVLHTLQTNLNYYVLSCHKMYKICRTTYTWPNEYIKQKISVNISYSYSKKYFPFILRNRNYNCLPNTISVLFWTTQFSKFPSLFILWSYLKNKITYISGLQFFYNSHPFLLVTRLSAACPRNHSMIPAGC